MEEWAEGFPALPESCPSSQQLLARLELPPSAAVREIREVDAAAAAGGRPALAARSLPRAALHHFKFKLQPPRGFALVWSSRAPGEADGEGGGKEGKEAFSVWAAELELGALAPNPTPTPTPNPTPNPDLDPYSDPDPDVDPSPSQTLTLTVTSDPNLQP